jgi:hypothetical protein
MDTLQRNSSITMRMFSAALNYTVADGEWRGTLGGLLPSILFHSPCISIDCAQAGMALISFLAISFRPVNPPINRMVDTTAAFG